MINIFQYIIDSRGSIEDFSKEEENKKRKNKNYKVDKRSKKENIKNPKNIL